MNVVLFDENQEIANKLGNILKEKLTNLTVYTDLLSLLNDFCDLDDFLNTLFLLSENILKMRNINIEQVLKKFNYYAPIITYRFTDIFYLKLDINYIYEYQVTNYKFFIDIVYKIEECFIQFINTKDIPSSYNFQCEEVPIHLIHRNKEEVQKLYKRLDVQKESNMCLTKIQTKLFRLLLSEKEGISLENIACNIWKSDYKSKSQNIYTLIHTLKRVISEKTNNEYQIIYHNKKYKLVKTVGVKTHFLASYCRNASITGNLHGCSIIN